jgi:hypothetical protein
MNLYTVKFRNPASRALIEIRVDDPDTALAAALVKLDTDYDDLDFGLPHEPAFLVNQIAIEDENGDEVALWLDDDYREMLCASELADALENIVRALRAPPSSGDMKAALEEADAVLTKARPPAPDEQTGIPAETAPPSAA